MAKTSKEMQPDNIVQKTLSIQRDLSALTFDEIERVEPQIEIEPETKLTNRQKADMYNCMYIEPKRRIPGFGKCPEHLLKQRDHDWEYVKGIYENYIISGEGIEFALCIYPGDDDCMWSIPANVPVFVPRMVAKHLEECQKYHTFEYKSDAFASQHGEFADKFYVSGTKSRGKFRPIGAFS